MSKMPKPLHEVLTERVVQLTGRRVRDLTVARPHPNPLHPEP